MRVTAFCAIAASLAAADTLPRLFQIEDEESALSESARVLVGHWRQTTIIFDSAQDEHLVLNADSTFENCTKTASGRGDTSEGTWSVEGKVLTLSFEETGDRSAPFTIYNGQLVFPNIQNRRGFWERLNE